MPIAVQIITGSCAGIRLNRIEFFQQTKELMGFVRLPLAAPIFFEHLTSIPGRFFPDLDAVLPP
jgi:hypothetical protein